MHDKRRKTKNKEKIAKCEDCRLGENLGEKRVKECNFEKNQMHHNATLRVW